MDVLALICTVASVIMGIALAGIVAMQTSKSEGLSGILAGGGGGGGKVGRERHFEVTSMWLAYGWLISVFLAALFRGLAKGG